MIRTRKAFAGTVLAAALTVTTAAQTSAQQPAAAQAPAPPPQNLQVFPKDTPRAEVLTAMRGFAAGLGVECAHCHVTEPRDFASDAKQAKKTARLMMQMTTHVNEMVSSGVGKPAGEVVKVQCVTCHRGKAIPENPPPPPPPAPAAAPAAQAPRQ